MSYQINLSISVVGIDIGKNSAWISAALLVLG